MTRVTSRSEPLFQSARVRLSFASRPTHIIRFSSGSLFAILKNTVRLRFDKNSVKPVYKTPVRVRFDFLFSWPVCVNKLVNYCTFLYPLIIGVAAAEALVRVSTHFDPPRRRVDAQVQRQSKTNIQELTNLHLQLFSMRWRLYEEFAPLTTHSAGYQVIQQREKYCGDDDLNLNIRHH